MEDCNIAQGIENSKQVQEILCEAGEMKEKTNKLFPELKEVEKTIETFTKIKSFKKSKNEKNLKSSPCV